MVLFSVTNVLVGLCLFSRACFDMDLFVMHMKGTMCRARD